MKAIAIFPGKKDSIHLENLKKPTLKEIKNDRGVLVKVLRTGVCGTDKEINDAEYGKAPSDSDFLIIGHESIGIVEEVGNKVTELNKGDLVVPSVRRPANTIYDELGMSDFTTSENFTERGIKGRHGYLTEYFVEEPEFLIKVPKTLEKIGTLLEPISIIEKGISEAYKIQERLKVWTPKKAAVIGAGSVGLLA
ncbi:MAG: glucose dehydrogenase, partial [Flavobacterium sp.]